MIRRSVVSFALLIGAATASSAQTADGPTPAVQPLGGPVVPGVCLLSREAMFANAAVGKAATARLQELAEAEQASVDAERAQVEAEARSLEGQPDNAETRQRREELARRWQALQQRAAHSSREIAATRAKALERIAREAQPVIADVYGEKGCGLILDRNSALGGNFANDLTPEVVRQLNARIQTITFERERLPQQQVSSANIPAS